MTLQRARTSGPPLPGSAVRIDGQAGDAGVDVPTIAVLMGLTTSHLSEHYIQPSGAHLVLAMADKAGKAATARRKKAANTPAKKGGITAARPPRESHNVLAG